MVKSICVQCGIETAQTYFKKDGSGPVCYLCMQKSGEYPRIIVLGDGTHTCAYDHYIMTRHYKTEFGEYYKDDFGRNVPCGKLPCYSCDVPAAQHYCGCCGQRMKHEGKLLNCMNDSCFGGGSDPRK